MARLGSIWDTIKDALGDLGADPNIAAAIGRAYAAPNLQNINAVVAAYNARGATPPPQLMQSLYERYYSSAYYTSYGYGGYYPTSYGGVTGVLPWIVGGVVLIMLLRR